MLPFDFISHSKIFTNIAELTAFFADCYANNLLQDDETSIFVVMAAIKIRRATERDIPDILFLIRELAEFEHGLNEVTTTEADLLRDGFGSEKLFECFVAESEDEIVGTAIYFFNYSTWNGKCLYLEDLIVKRKSRTSGVGTLLMNRVIETAKENGAKRISWQVLDWNVDAQDFYKKFGATMDAEWLNGRLNERQINNFESK